MGHICFWMISYHSSRHRSYQVNNSINIFCRKPGKTVLIIEDIVDTGYSMEYLIEHLKSLGAKKVLVATLFDKVVNRVVDVPIDFVGKVLDKNQFLVGYGLDYNGLHRNVPYVFIPTEEEVASWDKDLKQRT